MDRTSLARPAMLHGSCRRGAVVIWLPLAMLTLLAALALAVNYARLWTIRAELQAAADAAALAGAETLVGDDLLRGDPTALPALLGRASAEAILFAGKNPVQGQPLALPANPANLAGGDLVFGTLDRPRGASFVVAANIQDLNNSALAAVNAVLVNPRLTRARGNAPSLIFAPLVGHDAVDVQAVAAAMLDRDVIGLRPFYQHPLNLAPLALFSDPSGKDNKSWQYQVEEKNGKDAYRFDPVQNTFVSDAAGDGLYEFQAVLALDKSQASSANVSLVFLGVSDATGVSQQLLTGVTVEQLQDQGGQLVLKMSDNHLAVTGSGVGPADGGMDLTALQQSLQQLQQLAEPRIWPLYCSLNSGNQPVLCGFVAARVVTVTGTDNNAPLFRFTLQPTMISTATAVTDANQRGVGGIAIVNPYICKVRLVE